MDEQAAAMHRLKEACGARPGAVLEHPWDQDTYKVGGKMFAAFSGIGASCLFKATSDEQAVLIQDPAVSVAPYLGHRGWVSVEVTPESVELAIELMEASWRHVVAGLPKKLQAALTESHEHKKNASNNNALTSQEP